jgi:hypothetical protein
VTADAAGIARWLRDAAPQWFGTSAESWAVLGAVRRAEPKLAPTWLAATALTGDALSEAAAAEVAAAARRQDYYLRLLADLGDRFPYLRPIKGPAVVRCYPPGLVRHLGDLDAAVPTEDDAYAVGAALLADGWRRYSLDLRVVGGVRHVLLTVTRPADHPDEPIHGVQISTLEMSGNLLGLQPVPRLAGARVETRSLVSIVAERAERPYELRDLLDAVVLLRSLGTADVAEAGRVISDVALAPEARELASLLERYAADAPPLPVTPESWRTSARRAARVGAGMARPERLAARVAGHAVAVGRGARMGGALLGRLAERVPVRWALDAGCAVSGAPLDGAAATAVGRAVPDDVYRTPVGDWLLRIAAEPPARARRALAAVGEAPC